MQLTISYNERQIGILKKFYVALIDSISLQGKIERLIKKYSLASTQSLIVRIEVRKLSLKLNNVVCHINWLKTELDKLNKKV